MARPQKPLEDQLLLAEEELRKAEEKVVQCKQRISDIKQQIEERDMHDAYSLLKEKGISVKELEELLNKESKKKS